MADTASSNPPPTASGLTVSVVTPEQTVLETTADSVVLPLFDGELGVLKGHSPMIGRLGFGELRIHAGGHIDRYYVDAGFAQVAGDEVTVLTSRALPLSEIDAETAEAQFYDGLQRKAKNLEEAEMRDRIVSQARAQIRLSKKLL